MLSISSITELSRFTIDVSSMGVLNVCGTLALTVVTAVTGGGVVIINPEADPDQGVVLLCIAPGCEDDVEMILQDLKKDILIEQAG